MIKYKRSKV